MHVAETFAHLPRDLQARPKDFDALEKRNVLIERAPGFTAPRIGGDKPKPEDGKPKGTDAGGSSSSGSEPGDPGSAPVRLGTGSPSESNGGGAGNGPARIAGGDSASAPKQEPKLQPKPEDKPADDIPVSNVGASKPGDPGVSTRGDSKDFKVLQDKGARVDKEVHDAFSEKEDAELPNKLEDNYELDSEKGGQYAPS